MYNKIQEKTESNNSTWIEKAFGCFLLSSEKTTMFQRDEKKWKPFCLVKFPSNIFMSLKEAGDTLHIFSDARLETISRQHPPAKDIIHVMWVNMSTRSHYATFFSEREVAEEQKKKASSLALAFSWFFLLEKTAWALKQFHERAINYE